MPRTLQTFLLTIRYFLSMLLRQRFKNYCVAMSRLDEIFEATSLFLLDVAKLVKYMTSLALRKALVRRVLMAIRLWTTMTTQSRHALHAQQPQLALAQPSSYLLVHGAGPHWPPQSLNAPMA